MSNNIIYNYIFFPSFFSLIYNEEMKIWLISIPQIPRAVFRSSVEETDVDWLYTNPAPFPLVPGAVLSPKYRQQSPPTKNIPPEM